MEQGLLETSVVNSRRRRSSLPVGITPTGSDKQQGIHGAIQELADTLVERLRADVNGMTTKERADLLGKLLPYVCREETAAKETSMEELVRKYMQAATRQAKR